MYRCTTDHSVYYYWCRCFARRLFKYNHPDPPTHTHTHELLLLCFYYSYILPFPPFILIRGLRLGWVGFFFFFFWSFSFSSLHSVGNFCLLLLETGIRLQSWDQDCVQFPFAAISAYLHTCIPATRAYASHARDQLLARRSTPLQRNKGLVSAAREKEKETREE